jgi:hypothetical protein
MPDPKPLVERLVRIETYDRNPCSTAVSSSVA